MITQTILRFDIKQLSKSRTTIPVMMLWVAIILFSVYNVSIPQKRLSEKIETDAIRHETLYGTTLKEVDSLERGIKKIGVIWNNPQTAWVAATERGAQPIAKKPVPLGVIATGQSDLFSSLFKLNANPPWYVVMTPAEKLDDPVNQLYGNFDLSFVITWLLPLIVILFNYNLLSAEKEQQTLKLMVAQGVSPRRLLLMKLMLRFGCITLLTVLASVAAISIFANNGSGLLQGLLTLCVFITLYSACWHGLLLLINTVGQSTAWNAGMSFAAWLCFVIILPALLNITANNIFKTPSQVELITEIRKASTNVDQQSAKNLDKYFYDHPEFAPKDSTQLMPNYMYPVALAYDASSRIVYPKISLYHDQLSKQSRMLQNVGILSPSILMQEAVEEMSGNSMDDFLHYQAFADSANRKWMNFMFPRILGDKQISGKDYASFQQLQYSKETAWGKLTRIGIALMLWLVILVLIWLRLSKKMSAM